MNLRYSTLILTIAVASLAATLLVSLQATDVDAAVPLIAAAIAFVPAIFTYFAAIWSLEQSFNWQMTFTLGGTAIRSGATLAAALILFFKVPACQTHEFWLWLAVAYLTALFAETSLLMRALQRRRSREQAAANLAS